MHKATAIGIGVLGIANAMSIAGVVEFQGLTTIGRSTEISSQQFNLFNHPQGAVNPQLYGLRLDSFVDPSANVTFSFEDRLTNESNVQLIVRNFDDGSSTIQIVGEVWGNSASTGSFFGTFTLDVTYAVVTNPGVETGWIDPNPGPNDIGSLTQITDDNGDPFAGVPLVINTRSDAIHNSPFVFFQDGHRIDGDSTTWVGRGWVQDAGTTNDFLFTAIMVPIPSAVYPGLAGLLVLGGLHARRRRR